jgi:hypothetical protein
LEKNVINVIHSNQLAEIKGTSAYFIVCVQADYPHRGWAHYHFVHNKEQLGFNTSFIPFWVQPGLIPRNPSRNSVKRVAYSGQLWNGNFAGDQNDWAEMFKSVGLEFVTIAEGAWHDLSSVDILIGIRSFDKRTYSNKPATKLVNAWHARIPFIGGNDSAFEQLGTPGKDYLMANNLQEVLACVLQLSNNPGFYDQVVANGAKKAQEINDENVAAMWESALTGPVFSRYVSWKTHRFQEWFRFSTLLRLGISEYRSKIFLKNIRNISTKMLGFAFKM